MLYDVLAMDYDIAHVCVADLGYVMISCVYINVEKKKTIRTCEIHITTKFVKIDKSHGTMLDSTTHVMPS